MGSRKTVLVNLLAGKQRDSGMGEWTVDTVGEGESGMNGRR